MAIILTGGIGFVGSNMVRKLNEHGIKDIIIIDTYGNDEKMANLHGLDFLDIFDYKEGIPAVREYLESIKEPTAFFHIGANSNVMDYDVKGMMNQNYEFSKMYCEYAASKNIPFIYASSSAIYGNSKEFSIDEANSLPHNTYAYSKWLFDKYVMAHMPQYKNRVVGYRFFNVFGWNEFYKDETACLPYRFYSFIRDKGFIDLFKDHIERDYVWVDDLAEVLYQTMDKAEFENGIYNLGGNHPVSTRKVAEIVIETFMEKGLLDGTIVEKYIQLIDMPEKLRGKFQFYTHAEDQLEFISKITQGNEQKIRNYVRLLIDKKV
jgi:ADP-L-glycero-D-manno-heptose 6-epimerase